MYKNQLQELAQRSCFNLPAYACIREGPDHAPRFKATVNFNGELFESPGYFSTLRQAEHAAAEVALSSLTKRGPVQALAKLILDETGVCKNLLQETAQRAGVSLPVYTTVRSGPGHLPVFTCTVEVAGMPFVGEAAKTKKQAEKNAAMAAWSQLKRAANRGQPSTVTEMDITDEHDQNSIARALQLNFKDAHPGLHLGHSGEQPRIFSDHSGSSSDRSRGFSDFSGSSSDHSGNNLGALVPAHMVLQQRSSGRGSVEDRDRGMHGPRPSYTPHFVQPTWAPERYQSEMRYQGEDLQGKYVLPSPSHSQVQGHIQRSSPPSSSTTLPQNVVRHTSIAIKPGMAYQPRPRGPQQPVAADVDYRPAMAYQPRARHLQAAFGPGNPPRVPSRVVQPPSNHVLEVHEADEEEWLRGEQKSKIVHSAEHPHAMPAMYWPPSNHLWSSEGAIGVGGGAGSRGGPGMMPAPPVTVRTLVTVRASPRRRVEEEEEDAHDSIDGEAATRQVLRELSL